MEHFIGSFILGMILFSIFHGIVSQSTVYCVQVDNLPSVVHFLFSSIAKIRANILGGRRGRKRQREIEI